MENTLNDTFQENDEIVPESDSPEILLEEYDNIKKCRADDSVSAQAVICILVIVFLFVLNYLYPETAGEVLETIKNLSFSDKEIFRNPIDLVIEYCSALN